MIIGLNGYAKVGKDTFADMIKYHAKFDGFNWETKKFAYKLKQVASMLTGIPVDMFENQEFKDSNLPEEWNLDRVDVDGDMFMVTEGGQPMTVREFLQVLGTDAIRNHVHPNAWVNALMSEYRPEKMSEHNPSAWIITDVRFPNEAQAIKDMGGIVVRINRQGVGPTNNHESETALDYWSFDAVVYNDLSLEELSKSALNILNYMKSRRRLLKNGQRAH